MPETTEQVNHRAEALKWLDAAEREAAEERAALAASLAAVAHIYSNLAIAEELRETREAIWQTLGEGSHLDQIAQALRAIAEPEKYGIEPRSHR
jgi:hypothetical protein